MILKQIDNYIFRRFKWAVYICGIFFILYFEKFNLEVLLYIFKQVFIITNIWIFFVFLPRSYFLNYIIEINQFLFKYFSFLFKLRRELINLPYFLRMILSRFFFYFDRILRKILKIEIRKKDFFYFLRLILYLNIIIWVTFPFHLIIELYELILDVMNLNIKTIDFLKARIHYLLLSIIFILLLSISRIDLIIFLWILDRILDIICFFFVSIKEFKKTKWNDFDDNCGILYMVFMNSCTGYSSLLNYIGLCVENKRMNTILLFKGIAINKIGQFYFMQKISENQSAFWRKFIKFLTYWDWAYEYYIVDRDGQFFIRMLFKITGARDSEDFKEYVMNKELFDIEEYVREQFNSEFNEEVYNLMLKFVINLTNHKEYIDELFILLEKYPNFIYHKGVMRKNEEIKQFLFKLEKLSK